MFLFILTVHSLVYSILLNSSKGYYNYRHMTNLYLLKSIIKNSIILPFFPEDPVKLYKKIYISNKKTISYKKMKRIGYTSDDFIKIFYNSVFNKQDNVLIYMCGHGNDGIFKFFDKEWLTKEDLMRAVNFLCTKVNKVLLIIDTCQAETMVDRNIENLYIVTTSLKNENSYSTRSCDFIGVATVDNFMYELYNNIGYDDKESLNDFFGKIKNIGSTITCSNDISFLVSDFNLYKSKCK